MAGFELCGEDPTQCSFNATKDGVESCDDVCTAHGGACLEVFTNGGSNLCAGNEVAECSLDSHVDDICVCTFNGA